MIGLAPPIGQYAPDFELPDISGAVHHLRRYLEMKRAVLVVVLSNCCPEVHACLQELNALHQELSAQGIALVGINANDDVQAPEESYQNMKEFAQTHGLQFPYLRDMTQDVVRTFGAEKAPEAFLLDAEGKIQYTGAVLPSQSLDSLPQGSHTETPLRRAITQLLSGQLITVSSTPATGCPILWRKA